MITKFGAWWVNHALVCTAPLLSWLIDLHLYFSCLLKLCFLYLLIVTSYMNLISFTVLKMSFIDVVDLSSDDECGHLNVKASKLQPGIVGGRIQQKENKVQLVKRQKSETQCRRQETEENRGSRILDQGQSPVDDTSLPSTSPTCHAPLCRQFWKAGNYDDGHGSKVSVQSILLSTITY